MSNPIAVVRDVNSSPQQGRGVHAFVGKLTASGSAGVVTIETGLKTILFAYVYNTTDSALVANAEGNSTTYPGTKTVAFTSLASKTMYYIIVGSMLYSETIPDITTATTITYYPMRSQ